MAYEAAGFWWGCEWVLKSITYAGSIISITFEFASLSILRLLTRSGAHSGNIDLQCS